MVNRSSLKMSLSVWFMVSSLIVVGSFAGRLPPMGKGKPRTLQMIGATNPRMLHRISADLEPDTSTVVHIQVPYYIDRPKVRTKKFKPWIPRGHRFTSSPGGVAPLKHLTGPVSFGLPFPREMAPQGKPSLTTEYHQGPSVGSNPGPYDTPFVPVMKPSPVNPLHAEHPLPEIMFEPINILPLDTPSFATVRNHVNYLKQKQQAFFEGEGREFGFGGNQGATVPDELEYFGEHEAYLGTGAHNGDVGRPEGERNTLSEADFGQNDRKYDRRGKVLVQAVSGEQSEEADFYDAEGKQYQDDDFEDSREEADRAAAFEPKKVYTQVRHRDVVRHVPRKHQQDEPEEDEQEEEEDEDEEDKYDRRYEAEGEDDEEGGKEQLEDDDEDNDRAEEAPDGGSYKSKESDAPIKERVKLHRKNIVYSEKGREAQKFDHGSAESFGEFEEAAAGPKRSQQIKRNRIKRSQDETEAHTNGTRGDEVVEVLAWMILGNGSDMSVLPHPEALTDPRELHGEELIKFLDEAIQNTTQYLPEAQQERGDVISIVSPPSNVVKFPYYNRPAAEIDVDSALRYAENLTSFSTGLYGSKTEVECNEVDVELEDEPEPIGSDGDGGSEDGFRPIKRLKGLGDKIDCLRAKHFGREPLDNPLFREEFVGPVIPGRRSVYNGGKGVVPQPNPAVAVYNDVIRHIKKHLASQQRRKNSKADEQDTVMIAVPRVLKLDADEGSSDGRFTVAGGRKREPRLAFPQANPLPLSNHISVPIFDISKYVPRFMLRANDDLFAEDDPRPRAPVEPVKLVKSVKPRLSTPKVRLQTLVKTAEQLAEGAVAVEEGVERQLTTAQPVRDDIADAFDDVITKRPKPPAPLPPIHQYSVVEQEPKDGQGRPEPTFNKSGPPYAALALEPPVAQSILKQRIAPIERNQLDFLKGKRSTKVPVRKTRRPTVTRKKVLVFYH